MSQRPHGLYFPGFGRNKCTAYLGICTEAKFGAKVLNPVNLLSYKNNLGSSPLGWLLCNLLPLIQNKQSNEVNYRMQVWFWTQSTSAYNCEHTNDGFHHFLLHMLHFSLLLKTLHLRILLVSEHKMSLVLPSIDHLSCFFLLSSK